MSNTLSPSSDVFTDSVTQLAKTASKQRKLIFVGVAILVALLAAYSVYATKRSSRIGAGKDALFKARNTLETEMSALSAAMKPPSAKPAKPADPKNPTPPEPPFSLQGVKFDVGAKLPQSLSQLEAVAKDFEGVTPGFDAKMILGGLYLEHGSKAEDWAAATRWFESAASTAPTEMTVSALLGLGYAQEASGGCAEAVKTFEKALNYGNTIEQEDLLRSQARCYETLNDPAKAKSVYERIVSLFPASESARYAQNKITSLK